MKRGIVAFCLIFFLLSTRSSSVEFASKSSATDQDVAKLRDALIDFYISFGDCTQTEFCVEGGYTLKQPGGNCASTCNDSATVMNTLRPDGSWADVNYTDHTSAEWLTMLHLERLLSMIRSYRCTYCDKLHSNQALLSKVHLALGYWLEKNYPAPQWWWQDIGMPQYVGEIAILLNDSLTASERDGVVKQMAGAKDGSGTGENLMWTQQVAINREILNNNVSLINTIFENLWSNVETGLGDGIQPDGSFHFHGDILYAGGYGGDYALQIVSMAQLASGTAFQPPQAKLSVFDTYILDGQQYFIYGPEHENFFVYDLSTKGREITRAPTGNLIFPSYVFAKALNASYFVNSNRGTEYGRLATALSGSGEGFSGTKHFYLSDYTTHHRANYFISLKMDSVRMANNEVCNGEGVKSWHTGDGVLLPYTSGKEFLGIFPVWNWTALPGTTSRVGVNESADKVRNNGQTAFVGGCSESASGMPQANLAMSVMNFESSNNGGPDEQIPLSANKAWFFLEEGVLAMTNNITLETKEQEVVTTVNQCLLAGSVYACTSKSPTLCSEPNSSAISLIPNGTTTTLKPNWIHHDNILYLPVLAPSQSVPEMLLKIGPQSGRWKDINIDSGSPNLVTKDVFYLATPHGSSPTFEMTDFMYAVIPGVSLTKAPVAYESFLKNIMVTQNTPDAQVLLYNDPSSGNRVLFIALRTPNIPISVPEMGIAGLRINISSPCTFILRAVSSDEKIKQLVFSASNPVNEAVNITAEVYGTQDLKTAPGQTSNITCTQHSEFGMVSFVLPGGDLAGSTVSGACLF
eukprot:m.7542 g.7542  ORF g.7542 m.7542 type:complete len:804 (+) comp3731_c0_seq1:84-2495(+)